MRHAVSIGETEGHKDIDEVSQVQEIPQDIQCYSVYRDSMYEGNYDPVSGTTLDRYDPDRQEYEQEGDECEDSQLYEQYEEQSEYGNY